MYRAGRRARSRLDARGAPSDVSRDGAARVRRGGRVSLRPPPARRDPVRGRRTRWRWRSPRRRVAAGLQIVMLPAAYHRNGWDGEDLPPLAGQRRFCDPDVETFLERVEALRAGRAAIDGRRRRRRRAQRARGPARLARGDRRVLRAPRARAPRPRPRAAPRARRVPRRARLLADRAARADRLPRAARERDPRDPRVGRGRRAAGARPGTHRRLVPDDRGQSGRRLSAGDDLRAAGVPIAIGSDSQVRIDPFEEARELETGCRGASASCARGCWRRPATCGASCAGNGYRSLGLPADPADHADGRDRPRASGPARDRSGGSAPGAGHVRLGGGGCGSGR